MARSSTGARLARTQMRATVGCVVEPVALRTHRPRVLQERVSSGLAALASRTVTVSTAMAARPISRAPRLLAADVPTAASRSQASRPRHAGEAPAESARARPVEAIVTTTPPTAVRGRSTPTRTTVVAVAGDAWTMVRSLLRSVLQGPVASRVAIQASPTATAMVQTAVSPIFARAQRAAVDAGARAPQVRLAGQGSVRANPWCRSVRASTTRVHSAVREW
jgi:hypothetical protein